MQEMLKKLSGRSVCARVLPLREAQMEVAKEAARGAVNEAQKLASWPEGPSVSDIPCLVWRLDALASFLFVGSWRTL